VEKVKEMVINYRRITIKEINAGVGITISSCCDIFLNILDMK